jgi:hypothetical protein
MGQRRECMKRRRGINGRVDRNGNLMVMLFLKPNQPTFQGLQMENGNFVQKDSKPKKKVLATPKFKRVTQNKESIFFIVIISWFPRQVFHHTDTYTYETMYIVFYLALTSCLKLRHLL